MELHIKNVRMSFAHIRTPQKPDNPDETPKYKINGICDENTVVSFEHKGKNHTLKHSDIHKIYPILMKDKFGENVVVPAAAVLKANNFLYNRADQQVGSRSPKVDQDTGEYLKGYEAETMFFYGNSPEVEKPLVVDQKRRPLDATSGHPVNGDYVNIVLDAFAFEYKKKKGLSSRFKGVQYLREGEPFGGARPLEASAFDEEELEEELDEAGFEADDPFGAGDDAGADDDCF